MWSICAFDGILYFSHVLLLFAGMSKEDAEAAYIKFVQELKTKYGF